MEFRKYLEFLLKMHIKCTKAFFLLYFYLKASKFTNTKLLQRNVMFAKLDFIVPMSLEHRSTLRLEFDGLETKNGMTTSLFGGTYNGRNEARKMFESPCWKKAEAKLWMKAEMKFISLKIIL